MINPGQAGSRSLRILCAEDNEVLLAAMAELLRGEGHRVQCASDGEQALARIVSDGEPFDLLITDFQMPRLNGLGLVRQSRIAGYRGRVIVFAGALASQDRRSFNALAVDAVIEKPSRQPELIAAVEKIR